MFSILLQIVVVVAMSGLFARFLVKDYGFKTQS